VASLIYAGRCARNHGGVHGIRLIHDHRNQDGNSWGSQEAPRKTEAPLAAAKLSQRCRASRYLTEVMNVCHTSALNDRVPPSQARSVAAQPSCQHSRADPSHWPQPPAAVTTPTDSSANHAEADTEVMRHDARGLRPEHQPPVKCQGRSDAADCRHSARFEYLFPIRPTLRAWLMRHMPGRGGYRKRQLPPVLALISPASIAQ
jgi:hypothetical protein